MKKDYKIICFDADDTLWVNEDYYRETEHKFQDLLAQYLPAEKVFEKLLKTELCNLDLYGYGAKSFTLSMIETALEISDKLPVEIVSKIISLGKDLINRPLVVFDDVELILNRLRQNGKKMIIATKGDLLDQERKLARSGVTEYFHHVEIMSDKKEKNYQKLLSQLGIMPEEFLMIGNSLKSDIIPVLNIGGHAIYIPHKSTWAHEAAKFPENNDRLIQISKIIKLIEVLDLK